MSGRRLREAIKKVMNDGSDDEISVIVAGLCNTYSDYVTTPEEYQVNCSFLLPNACVRSRTTLRTLTSRGMHLFTFFSNVS